jgi:hypothetical protein
MFPVHPISPFPFRGSTEPCCSLVPSKIRVSFDPTGRNSRMRSASSYQGHDQRQAQFRDDYEDAIEGGRLGQPLTRYCRHGKLLECDLGETSELARMQAFPILGLQLFQRLQPDREVLADALAIEFAGHAGEL